MGMTRRELIKFGIFGVIGATIGGRLLSHCPSKEVVKGKVAREEKSLDEILEILFEGKSIHQPKGQRFSEYTEQWRRRYNGEDIEYNESYRNNNLNAGRPPKTLSEELRGGWNELVSSGKLRRVYEIAQEENVPFDIMIPLAFIESGGNENARSPAGAAGMWQLMPKTAEYYGLRVYGVIDERYDFEKSTKVACKHINDLRKETSNIPEISLVKKRNWFGRIKRDKRGDPIIYRVVGDTLDLSNNNHWIATILSYNRGSPKTIEDFGRAKGDPETYIKICPSEDSVFYAPIFFGMRKALKDMFYKKGKGIEERIEERQVEEKKNIEERKIEEKKIEEEPVKAKSESQTSPADRMFEWYNSNKSKLSNDKKATYLENVVETYKIEGENGVHTQDYVINAIKTVDAERKKYQKEIKPKYPEKHKLKGKKPEYKAPEAVKEGIPQGLYHVKRGDNINKIARWFSPSPDNVDEIERLIAHLNHGIKKGKLGNVKAIKVPANRIIADKKLSVIVNKYYHGVGKESAKDYIKLANGINPDKGVITPGQYIFVPLQNPGHYLK